VVWSLSVVPEVPMLVLGSTVLAALAPTVSASFTTNNSLAD
jgi:hypothetical protein